MLPTGRQSKEGVNEKENPAPLVFHGCVFVAKRGRIHSLTMVHAAKPYPAALTRPLALRSQQLPRPVHPAAAARKHGVAPPGSTPPALTPAFSCLQSSGVQVMPDCLTEFEAMKIRSAYKVCSPLRASLQRAEEQERPFLTC